MLDDTGRLGGGGRQLPGRVGGGGGIGIAGWLLV
jgi:hypothetical protein